MEIRARVFTAQKKLINSLKCIRRKLTKLPDQIPISLQRKSEKSEDEIIFAANVQDRKAHDEIEFQFLKICSEKSRSINHLQADFII